jgi:hypothetical protein
MDDAGIGFAIGQSFQPRARIGKLVGSRQHPDAAGGYATLLPDRSHPIKDIDPSEVLPALVIGHAAAVMVVQGPAAMTAANAYKSGHVDFDPDAGRSVRPRTGSGCGGDTENQGTDARKRVQRRGVTPQLIKDVLFQLVLGGRDRFGLTGSFCPYQSATDIEQDIGAVAEYHGPDYAQQVQLGRILGESDANRIQGLIDGQELSFFFRHFISPSIGSDSNRIRLSPLYAMNLIFIILKSLFPFPGERRRFWMDTHYGCMIMVG